VSAGEQMAILDAARLPPTATRSLAPDDEQFQLMLAAATVGAEWALARLYETIHPGVVRFLLAQEPSAGEDIASETWIRVAAGLGRFTGGAAAFRAWVFRIARCTLIDHRRQRARRPTDVIDLRDVPATHDTAEQVMTSVAAERAVELVRRLPEDQCQVILLRVLAGLGTDEVASIMGKRAGHVRVLQHRALKKLAAFLRDEV
jgi:RNA polymerase sigma-70 factor (ECF subfamily)